MNDRESILRKESIRYQILKYFYDKGEQAVINSKDITYDIFQNGEISKKDLEEALHYLTSEKLLTPYFGHGYSLNHSGSKEIESSIKHPQSSTNHFNSQTIQLFIKELSMGDIIVGNSNSNITNRSSIDNSFNTNDATTILKEFAIQVENILKELEKRNQNATEQQQINYIDAVIEPDLKQRLMGLGKNTINTYIEEFILDNPLYKYSKVLNKALDGWQNGLG
jgi:hypothetical protein